MGGGRDGAYSRPAGKEVPSRGALLGQADRGRGRAGGIGHQGRADRGDFQSQRNARRAASEVVDCRRRPCYSRSPLPRRMQQQPTERGPHSHQEAQAQGLFR